MKYLIETLIPANQPHILTGASGAGKTTLLFQILRNFLDKEPIFGHTHTSGTLGYIVGDRCEDEYQEKFELMRLKPFPILSLVDHKDFEPKKIRDPEKRAAYLEHLIGCLGNPTLVVCDPLALFIGAKNLNDYMGIMEAFMPINRMCKRLGVTLIGTHHAGKLRETTKFNRVQDRVNGSGALLGFTGTQMILSDAEELDNNENRVYEFRVVPHNYPPRTFKLVRDQLGFHEYRDEDAQLQASIDAADLLGLIPNYPLTISGIDLVGAGTGKSRATIYRQLGQLEEVGLIKRNREGYFRRGVA